LKTAARVWLPFEVTEFDPKRYGAWKVEGVQATGHRVELLDDKGSDSEEPGGCRLIFEVPPIAFPCAQIPPTSLKK